MGLLINHQKSCLTASQKTVYFGIQIDAVSFRASPSTQRVDSLPSKSFEISYSQNLLCERMDEPYGDVVVPRDVRGSGPPPNETITILSKSEVAEEGIPGLLRY